MNGDAKEIYDMGKRLCELAESMGYSDEGEGMDEEAPMAEQAAEPFKKKPNAGGKKGKLEIALGFLK